MRKRRYLDPYFNVRFLAVANDRITRALHVGFWVIRQRIDQPGLNIVYYIFGVCKESVNTFFKNY